MDHLSYNHLCEIRSRANNIEAAATILYQFYACTNKLFKKNRIPDKMLNNCLSYG